MDEIRYLVAPIFKEEDRLVKRIWIQEIDNIMIA
jgi:hypothetical protein